MGRESYAALTADARFDVVAVLTRDGQAPAFTECPAYRESTDLLMEQRPDVWLDFTDSESVVRHIDESITFGVRPVVGATGYTPVDVERWHQMCLANDIGGVAAPNFAIGALLMMRFAAEAARFFQQAEIVEYHHAGKKDAPSGTAKRTAEAMHQAREHAATAAGHPDVNHVRFDSAPVRGQSYVDVPIHSVRLPGLVAHQEVLFGGTGEILTIRHDSLARTSFMPGVLLACEQVMGAKGLVYGLDQLLW